MTPSEIVQKWLQYSNYDPNEHVFNILSTHYEMHSISDQVAKMMEFDPNCVLSVMYIKKRFQDMCSNIRVSVADILNNNTGLDDKDREMWELLHADNIVMAENEILNAIDKFGIKSSAKRQIGERNLEAERAVLADAVLSVVEQLKQCNVELYVHGGLIQPLANFSTSLHIFNTLAECLYALENTNDGAFVCYIACGGTSDGYFGYFIKSNGNIFSVNERINEAFPGQHKRSRNGRWVEQKAFGIFPYSILQGDNFDYLGYASKVIIDDENLEIFKLDPNSYIPLMLGLIMVNNKYQLRSPDDINSVYVDSLLPQNLHSIVTGDKALLPIQHSMIAKQHEQYTIPYTSADILSGAPAARFKYNPNDWRKPHGSFLEEKSIFVELYGDGFKLDTSRLLDSSTAYLLAGEQNEQYTPEFVGTQARFDLIAYQQGRRQLADYIRDQMLEEYLRFGGGTMVQEWWTDQLVKNKERLIELCVQKWVGLQNKSLHNPSGISCTINCEEPLKYIYFDHECKNGVISYNYWTYGMTSPISKMDGDVLRCCINESKASFAFIICIQSWKDFFELFNLDSIPKCLMGYERHKYRSIGNSLLDVTDPVAEIGNVFERDEQKRNKRLWTQADIDSYQWLNGALTEHVTPLEKKMSPANIRFICPIGFSKRAWKIILRSHGIDPNITSSGSDKIVQT